VNRRVRNLLPHPAIKALLFEPFLPLSGILLVLMVLVSLALVSL